MLIFLETLILIQRRANLTLITFNVIMKAPREKVKNPPVPPVYLDISFFSQPLPTFSALFLFGGTYLQFCMIASGKGVVSVFLVLFSLSLSPFSLSLYLLLNIIYLLLIVVLSYNLSDIPNRFLDIRNIT